MNELDKMHDFIKNWEEDLEKMGVDDFRFFARSYLICVSRENYLRDSKIIKEIYKNFLMYISKEIPSFDNIYQEVLDLNFEIFKINSQFEFLYGDKKDEFEDIVFNEVKDTLDYEASYGMHEEAYSNISEIKKTIEVDKIRERSLAGLNKMATIYADLIPNLIKEFLDDEKYCYIAPHNCTLYILSKKPRTKAYLNTDQGIVNEWLYKNQIGKALKHDSIRPDYNIKDYMSAKIVVSKGEEDY